MKALSHNIAKILINETHFSYKIYAILGKR